MTITIAVDAMGGDVGLKVTVPAALHFLRDYPNVELILVGDEAAMRQALGEHSSPDPRLHLQHADEVISMDESPQAALKGKKNSSMRITLNLVKDGVAQAAVSAGNTGALMAIARFVLKTLPGIARPAIAKLLPNRHGTATCALDLGASIDSDAERLVQFGIMGVELVSAIRGIENPTVGLLNVGTEDIKGSECIREAAEMMKESGLNYHGFVEGNDIYLGSVDVVVTDGFTGNVALKTSEGLARMIAIYLKEEYSRGLWSKLAAVISAPVLRRFRDRADARRYNGASLLGLRGSVVKSHGGTDETGFYFALLQAYKEAQNDVITHIAERIEQQLKTIQQPVPAQISTESPSVTAPDQGQS